MNFKELFDSLGRSWRHHFLIQVLTLSVLSGVFTVSGICLLIGVNLNKVMIRWSDDIQMTVFLKDQATDAQIQDVRSHLQAESQFKKVEWISKDRARETFSKTISTYAPELIEDPEFKDAFPASFQVSLVSEAAAKGMNDLVKKIASLAGVNDVSFGQGWVANYSKFVTAIHHFGWAVSLIILAGSFFIVGNTLRMSIHQRSEEIEILELIGATRGRIAAPFLFEGVFMGFLASLIATAFTYVFYQIQTSLIVTELPFLNLSSEHGFFSAPILLLVVVIGSSIGFLGSLACVRSIADGWWVSRKKNKVVI